MITKIITKLTGIKEYILDLPGGRVTYTEEDEIFFFERLELIKEEYSDEETKKYYQISWVNSMYSKEYKKYLEIWKKINKIYNEIKILKKNNIPKEIIFEKEYKIYQIEDKNKYLYIPEKSVLFSLIQNNNG